MALEERLHYGVDRIVTSPAIEKYQGHKNTFQISYDEK
jgi:hypothetical protein